MIDDDGDDDYHDADEWLMIMMMIKRNLNSFPSLSVALGIFKVQQGLNQVSAMQSS